MWYENCKRTAPIIFEEIVQSMQSLCIEWILHAAVVWKNEWTFMSMLSKLLARVKYTVEPQTSAGTCGWADGQSEGNCPYNTTKYISESNSDCNDRVYNTDRK